MVAFDVSGQVREILIKQAEGARLYYTWSLAVWRPSFTEFLHEWIKDADGASQLGRELFVGDVFIAAQAAGLRVDAAVVSSLGSLDAGTPETLALARSIRW
jgi:glucose-1-phosphate thymidylyltransferase